MTKEELVEKLKACKNNATEEGHIEADCLLLEYINDPDVTAAFRALNKWYA